MQKATAVLHREGFCIMGFCCYRGRMFGLRTQPRMPSVTMLAAPRQYNGCARKVHVRAGSESTFCTSWLQAKLGLSADDAERVIKTNASASKAQVSTSSVLASVDSCLQALGGNPAEAAFVVLKQPALLSCDLDAWLGLFKQLGATKGQVKQLLREHGTILASGSAQRAHAFVSLMRTFGMQDTVLRKKLLVEFPVLMTLDVESQVVPALDIMRNLFAHSDAKFLAKQTGEEDSASSTHPGTQPVTSSSPQQANGKQEDPATAASRMLLESTWQAQQKQQDGSNGPQATPPSSPAMSEQSSTCGSAASGTSGAAQTKQGAGMGSSRSSSSSESGQGGGRGMKVAWEEYAASAGISTQDTGMGNTLDAALAAARAALARQKVTGAFFAGSGSGAWGQSGQQGSGNVSSSGAGSGLRFTGMGMPSMHSRAASASGRGRKGGRGAGRRGYVVQEGSHGARLLMGRPLELAPVPPDMPPAELAFRLLMCNYPELLLFMLFPDVAEELKRKMAALREAGLDVDISSALLFCPGLFKVDVRKTFVPKLRLLRGAGFSDAQLRGVLAACPTLLWRSKRDLQRNITFLQRVVGATPADMLCAPQVLAADVVDELGPAYAFLCLRFPEETARGLPEGEVAHPAEGGRLAGDHSHTEQGHPSVAGLGAVEGSVDVAQAQISAQSGPQGVQAGSSEAPAMVGAGRSGGSGSRSSHPLWVQRCAPDEGRLRLGVLLALAHGTDVIIGDADRGVRMERLPPWFDGPAYERASQDWKAGPGKGWK